MRISAEGNDMYICQICGRDLDSVKYTPSWRPDLTKRTGAGNVCPQCITRLESNISVLTEEEYKKKLDIEENYARDLYD
jgi:hypothetical protein